MSTTIIEVDLVRDISYIVIKLTITTVPIIGFRFTSLRTRSLRRSRRIRNSRIFSSLFANTRVFSYYVTELTDSDSVSLGKDRNIS